MRTDGNAARPLPRSDGGSLGDARAPVEEIEVASLVRCISRISSPAWNPTGDRPRRESLGLPDAEVVLFERFLPMAVAEQAFTTLRDDIDWEQESYVMYGRDIPVAALDGVVRRALGACTPILE